MAWDECNECGAMVQMSQYDTSSHDRWHLAQDLKIENLESEVQDLTSRIEALENRDA